MRSPEGAQLGAFGVVLGERTSIESLPELAPQIESLRAKGFAHYRDAGSSGLLELGKRCIAQSLSARGGSAPPIEAVVIGSASLDRLRSLPAREFSTLLHEAGLSSAALFPVLFPSCHNTSSMLEIGLGILHQGRARSVLLLNVDTAEPGRRLLSEGLAILSDGAVSCVLSMEPSELEIVHHHTASDHALVRHDGQPRGAFRKSMGLLSAIKAAVVHTLKEACVDPESELYLASNNYNSEFSELLIHMLGDLRLELTTLELNRSELSHVFSCDPWINLRDILSTKTLRPGAHVLVLYLGDYGWGLTLLRRSAEQLRDAH